MAEGESKRLKDLEHNLKHKVIAQDNAINKMVKTILRNRVGLRDPNHPIGVFMFLGPTGVGKTYLAQKLAEELFGSKDSLIRIDMSEFSESFNTSRLVGAPPGYVGYNEGGQLTEKVRRNRESQQQDIQPALTGTRRRQTYRWQRPTHRLPQHHHHHDL